MLEHLKTKEFKIVDPEYLHERKVNTEGPEKFKNQFRLKKKSLPDVSIAKSEMKVQSTLPDISP